MKIVINGCYGGFDLSAAACERLLELGSDKIKVNDDNDTTFGKYFEMFGHEDRNDPLLVKVVEEMGRKANGRSAELSVVDVPDDVKWTIEEYDGVEHVAEVHRTWG
jgi:hypothetical protein